MPRLHQAPCYQGNGVMWRTPATLRRSLDDVPDTTSR
jgi:hypothetical protein